MARGIRDRVAILGMGCTRFGEHWDLSAEDLMVEAFSEALEDAGVGAAEIDAAWLGLCFDEHSVGKSGLPLAETLRLPNVPVTRVENFCASGTEAFRGAAYAVAAGACDIALALGAEKLKDTGYGGLPQQSRGTLIPQWWANVSAPGAFAQLAPAYCARHGVDSDTFRRAIAHVSVKSHANGLKSPKAHLRREIGMNQVLGAPTVAAPLGLYDCCGVSDGAAAAIVTTPEIARAMGRGEVVSVKALQLAATDGTEAAHASWDGASIPTTRHAARRAYAEAGITDPAAQLDLTEVHDCFSITELVTMEDLGLSAEGSAVAHVLDGRYDAEGAIPCQTDGGLKCFGHPVGASGLRMLYEIYLQLLDRAGDRQRGKVDLGLTHNLGGLPLRSIASVAILGRMRA